jgi:hypothetical protein
LEIVGVELVSLTLIRLMKGGKRDNFAAGMALNLLFLWGK